jgi:CheY-like chemotaxis protein
MEKPKEIQEMKYQILVTDDDRGIRKLLSITLTKAGYSVDTAESGKCALELVQQKRYHLIILDLKMPEMDGITTLRGIRELEPHIPVYFHTAFQSEYMEQLKDLKNQNVEFELLQKPVGKNRLLRVVDQILESNYTHVNDRTKK